MFNRILCVLISAALIEPGHATAAFHCDGMDGPVVKAAQAALESGNVNRVLIWVQPADETEIRKAFAATLAVRDDDSEARELADRYFFETVVRVHRAGEGATYAGLQPPGRDLGPAIPAADRAVADGAAEPLVSLIQESVEHGLRERLEAVLRKQSFDPEDVAAGREYVQAYVEFVHYVERLYGDAQTSAHGHFPQVPRH